MIAIASAASERICEICGQPGCVMIESGWYRARCAKHVARRTDDPIPVLYTFPAHDTEHVIGHVAVSGTPAVTGVGSDVAGLLAAARKEGYEELQIVRVRDLAELPTRIAE